MKLYRSAVHPGCWVAYVPENGWLVFPARNHGWEERRPARGLDPVHLRQVPPGFGAEAGFPQAKARLAKVA